MFDTDLKPQPGEGEFAFLKRMFATPIANLIRAPKDENAFPVMQDGRRYRPCHDRNGLRISVEEDPRQNN